MKERLARLVGEGNVFFDFHSINFGLDFRNVIHEVFSGISIVVLLIGSAFHAERLHRTDDIVGLELREAVTRGTFIMPALVDGAPMPKADAWPPELAEIAYINAAPLHRGREFDRDTERFVRDMALSYASRVGRTRGLNIIRFPDGSTGAV